ncbi:hypothetical protein VNO77_43318 [Canavalia gladiata]|uniref:Uncharacterized protein n=1 Tax=Canavalia gladiata TaxID=3824 RepID=A0AAN9JUL3_CANGL
MHLLIYLGLSQKELGQGCPISGLKGQTEEVFTHLLKFVQKGQRIDPTESLQGFLQFLIVTRDLSLALDPDLETGHCLHPG